MTATLLALLVCGCFRTLEAPSCHTLADCPLGAGYTACEDGTCFRTGAECAEAVPEPGDGCCPSVEADRSDDSDCLALDLDLEGRDVVAPAVGPGGELYVAYVGGDGDAQVKVRRVDAGGVPGPAVTVGRGLRALPPVLSGGTLFVAYELGVMRYQLPEVVDLHVLPSDRPVGGLVATGEAPGRRRAVAWPTATGRFVIYDEETADVVWNQDLMLGEPDPAAVFPPVVSGSGRRVLLLGRGGTLVALEVGANPVGPVAVTGAGAPATGPLEVDGVVYVARTDGTLATWTLGPASLEERWVLDLGGVATGGLLADPDGRVVAMLQDGTVVAVRDGETRGILAAQARLGAPAADLYPALGEDGRVIALAAGGQGVRTAILEADAGRTGLWFDLAVAGVSAPVLAPGRLVLGTATGRLQAWRFPGQAAPGRFVGLGGDAGHTGRTTPTESDRGRAR